MEIYILVITIWSVFSSVMWLRCSMILGYKSAYYETKLVGNGINDSVKGKGLRELLKS